LQDGTYSLIDLFDFEEALNMKGEAQRLARKAAEKK